MEIQRQQSSLSHPNLPKSIIKKTQSIGVLSPATQQVNYEKKEAIYSNAQIIPTSNLTSSVIMESINNQEINNQGNGVESNGIESKPPPRPTSKPNKFVSEEVRKFIEKNRFDTSSNTIQDLSFTQVP